MKTMNMRKTKRASSFASALLVSVFVLGALAACNQNSGSADVALALSENTGAATPAVAAGTFDYATIKSQIFVPHCLKCHSTDTAKGDVDLETYASAIQFKKELREVIETNEMPRKAPPLADPLKAMLFAWLDAGAPEK